MFDCSKCLMKCKADCCGPVPHLKSFVRSNPPLQEIEKSFDMGDYVVLITKEGKCPYLAKDFKCSIYNDRPEVCRKFGDETHPNLICKFQSADGRIRSRQERRDLDRKLTQMVTNQISELTKAAA